ncbi:MAG: glycosyltransferase, partial [Planctomycetes bacterium]|nr:glycosyltransferase [Planctomycetota bacterium]
MSETSVLNSQQIDKSLWPETSHGRWMSEDYEPGLVSVIIPTYNRAQGVIASMDSVLAQSYRPLEL